MHVSSARAGMAPDSRAASAAPTMNQEETCRAMAMPFPGCFAPSDRRPKDPDPGISADARHRRGVSPCRNAGTATGAPATDRDGDGCPQEGAFDIGADEFVP